MHPFTRHFNSHCLETEGSESVQEVLEESSGAIQCELDPGTDQTESELNPEEPEFLVGMADSAENSVHDSLMLSEAMDRILSQEISQSDQQMPISEGSSDSGIEHRTQSSDENPRRIKKDLPVPMSMQAKA